jgi:hypothetical protein
MLALKTIRMPWINLGTISYTAADDDAALGVAERTLGTAKLLTNVVYKAPIPTGINTLEARFLGTTNGKDAQYTDVWAGRLNEDEDCDLIRVCTLVPEIGTNDVLGSSTLHFADEITITNNDWIKTVSAIQSSNDSELIARIVFDLCGYDAIVFHGHSAAYTEDIQVEISGY